ncbi:AMP-binding protein [Carboxylicivirga taeanensis]|uniref:AMP-binding protein n=1 Tax=Carboxylicivirga taeanensis TaxID=1416875 RepID=UPI003F6E30D3
MKTNSNLHKTYDTLTVEGQVLSGIQSIIRFSEHLLRTDSEANHHIGQFLQEWFDEREFISIQTSGSTGQPKRIEVKKQAMIHSAKRTIEFFDLQKGNSALLCLSAKYIAGKMMLIRALVGGLNLFLGDVSVNPLQNHNQSIDFAAMVPMQLQIALANSPSKINAIKKLIIGGGSVHPSTTNQLNNLQTEIWETYGMTETVSHIALRNLKNDNNLFKLLPGLNIDVDERGCLCILPSDINEQLLCTNDLVEQVHANEFRILGRYDNIINSGGIKLMPERIESKLTPYISHNFAISWKTDRLLGQKVVLVIETDLPLRLNDFNFSMLSKYEVPKELITLPQLPLTETGKIQRVKLHELLC